MSKKLSATTNEARVNQRGAGIIGAIIGIVLTFVLVVLALRFLFRLFGADPGNGFVSWIYNASAPMVSPFLGIFNHDTTVNLSTGRLEFETLLAIVVYGVAGSLVLGITSWGYRRHHHV